MPDSSNYKDIPAKNFTLKSFLTNPTGDAGTQAIARKSTLEAYEVKLRTLLKSNKTKLKINYLKVEDSLFMHLEIPSETFDKFFYDVLIEFENFEDSQTTLETNRINFFSNSPSFAYTYAHTFQVFGISIIDLSNKFPDKIFTELPKVRNPDYHTFYEKTITFALIYIRDNSLTTVSNFKSKIQKLPASKLGKGIISLEDKMTLYAALKSGEARKKKAEKRKLVRKETTSGKKKNTTSKDLNNKVNSRVDNKVNNKVLNRKVNSKAKMKVK